jgi:hypothetical protein
MRRRQTLKLRHVCAFSALPRRAATLKEEYAFPEARAATVASAYEAGRRVTRACMHESGWMRKRHASPVLLPRF